MLSKSALTIGLLLARSLLPGPDVLAQATGVLTRGPLRSADRGLQSHGVATDEASVLRALQSPDAEVRWLAAEKFGNENNKSAIPQIESALLHETNTRAKINIAAALAELDDKKGLESLTASCNDKQAPIYMRLDAVRHLLNFKDQDCSVAVIDGLRLGPESDPATRLQSLSLITKFSTTRGSSLEEARPLVSQELIDPNPAIRAEASRSLAQIGDSSSLLALREAYSREKDEDIRSTMQDSINSLERKLLSDVRVVN